MRKVYHILLSLVILTSTTGISVSKHYCGGELQDVAVNSKSGTCSDMPVDMGCCEDDIQFYTLDDDFRINQFSVEIEPPTFENLFVTYITIPEVRVIEKFQGYFYYSHSPPFRTNIYIQVQSFLI